MCYWLNVSLIRVSRLINRGHAYFKFFLSLANRRHAYFKFILGLANRGHAYFKFFLGLAKPVIG